MSERALLVVDDAKPNRDMLSRRLVREGYRVLTAESGPEALRLVAENAIALVLLDLMMPGMSGTEVLQELRKNYDDRQLPILMVSANTDSPVMGAAIDLGANDYLTKPVDFEVLLAKVRRHLKAGGGASTAGTAVAPVLIAPPMAPPNKAGPLQVGDSLAHYRLDKLLGEGGMGQVYQAHDTRLLRDVAIKVILGEGVTPELLGRFMVEARAVARVSHPGVVTIYEVSTEPRHYIAMELIRGRPLEDYLEEKSLTPPRAVELMRQVLEALQVVHQAGITHRDLKPANIMVCPSGRVKVLDFGLAKVEDVELGLTKTGQVWGTPRYMAPEQIDPNFGKLDRQTDLFAAAAILYEAVSGKPPFPGKTLNQLIYEILLKEPQELKLSNGQTHQELGRILARGLEKKKDLRYQSSEEFLEDLRRVSF